MSTQQAALPFEPPRSLVDQAFEAYIETLLPKTQPRPSIGIVATLRPAVDIQPRFRSYPLSALAVLRGGA